MSAVVDLLAQLHGLGVTLYVAGEQLRYRAPKGVMTPDLRQALSEQKETALRLLLVREYDRLGAEIDVLTDRAIAARERGDQDEAARINAQCRTLCARYFAVADRLRALPDHAQDDSPETTLQAAESIAEGWSSAAARAAMQQALARIAAEYDRLAPDCPVDGDEMRRAEAVVEAAYHASNWTALEQALDAYERAALATFTAWQCGRGKEVA